MRPRRHRCGGMVLLAATLASLPACRSASRRPDLVYADGQRDPACQAAGGNAAVAKPVLVRNIATGETGWFSSPAVVDLDGDGHREIVAPFSSTFVFAADGTRRAKGTASRGRVYAPGVVADLDGDGTLEIVLTTFDHGVDLFTVPGSGENCLPWPTGRGSALRNGAGPSTAR